MDQAGAIDLGTVPRSEEPIKPSMLEFDVYQRAMRATAIYPGAAVNLDSSEGDALGVIYTSLGLAGEAGEIANKVKKLLRDGTFDPVALAAELGDVMWYLSSLAWELGVPLSSIAQYNHDKLMARKANDTLQGEGDNR